MQDLIAIRVAGQQLWLLKSRDEFVITKCELQDRILDPIYRDYCS